MHELVMIGFVDKHRAIEVLSQLQRLKFDWCADLQNAIAVEVERDGRLRVHHSQLLDPCIQLEYPAVESHSEFDRPLTSYTGIEFIRHYRRSSCYQ